MKIAICDDNYSERRKLGLFLRRLEREEQVRMDIETFDSGEALLTAHKSGERFDALFLEICMRGISGLSVAKSLLQDGFKGSVIFCTSSADYALESYKLKADGYIVKPFEYNDFVEAIWRCREKFDKRSVTFRAERLDCTLPLSDIYYIETRNRGCAIHTADREYITCKKISEFEQEFKSYETFLRLGRSYIVNLMHAESCGSDELVMKNGATMPLPVRERAKYRQYIYIYIYTGRS